MIKLFVYGILKDILPGKPASIKATCYNLGHYPAITRLGGRSKVKGQIIEVAAAELERFDRIEGYPDLYHRQLVKIGDDYCQVYVYTNPDTIPADTPRCFEFRETRKRNN